MVTGQKLKPIAEFSDFHNISDQSEFSGYVEYMYMWKICLFGEFPTQIQHKVLNISIVINITKTKKYSLRCVGFVLIIFFGNFEVQEALQMVSCT